ncbi:hypothetical protein COY28_01220 [Candidatus Woesearchaeota archaeon CG_4_10_14_0_2_um_filter_57_5]|nr:MAG: hypothetical protein AUJ68_06200 [Candidatus Woesearchaeota archaeon CG1_02_57_44]PIN68281.1 MAG: hypothetical protein COV94_05550 [Candidatus Woesearchaeota archaeon CG11_big_fil_rev_8_21_14_0_20_57_5]PIZ56134.1 MAG: hypothetical protein COY28_01220 [Candidatus Woesearchaeota archaeon CG_4_10_14_0_2_um_filter_57_5]
MVAEHRTALDAEEAGIKTALQGLMGMYVRSRAFTLEGTVAAEHAGNAGTLTLHNVRPLDRMALYYLFNEHEVPVLNIGPGVDSVDALYRILFEHLPGAKSHSELRSFFPEERDLALINHFHDKHYAVIPLHDVGSSSQYFAAFLTGRSAEHSADIFRTENVSVCRFHGTRYKKTPGFPVFASGYFDDADWEMPGFKQHRFTELLATVYTTFVQEGIYDKLHLKMQTATR